MSQLPSVVRAPLIDTNVQTAVGAEQLDPDMGTSGDRLLRPRSLLIDQTPSRILTSNPRRKGAYIFNAGGKLELQLDLGVGSRTGAALPQTAFLDSAGIQVPSYSLATYKSFYLLVDTQIAHAAGQATAQLIVGRGPWSPASGAATIAGGDNQNALKGAAVNIGGAAATTLGRGLFVLSPVDFPDLQWPHPYVGVEFNWTAALTAGAARLFLGMPLGPAVLLGNDQNINPDPGDRANSMMLAPQAPWTWIPTTRELWAAATPGGNADVRIWEIFHK